MNRAKIVAGRERSRRAFTLIELLITIGIVALLLGILLPTIGRARSVSHQVSCLSNLRQLGQAFFAYANNNDGRFPRHAPGPPLMPRSDDWIYWQVARDITQSPIARQMGIVTPESFRCPADEVLSHTLRAPNVEIYRYSYTMNYLFSNNRAAGDKVARVGAIKNVSNKILLIDEDSSTVDDGNWNPTVGGIQIQLVSTRHDGSKASDDARGNVCFADGHAEFIERGKAQQPEYYDPFIP